MEVFRRADCTEHQAKILAAKVRSFPPLGHPLTPEGKERLRAEMPRRRRELERALREAEKAAEALARCNLDDQQAREVFRLVIHARVSLACARREEQLNE